mgnify:CR=1 FL=1
MKRKTNRWMALVTGVLSVTGGLLLGATGCLDPGTCPSDSSQVPEGEYQIPVADYPGVNEGTLTLGSEDAEIEYVDDDGTRWVLRYTLYGAD